MAVSMAAALDLTIAEPDNRSPHLPVVAKWLNDEWGLSQGYDLSETMAWCDHLARAKNETLMVATRNDRLVGTVAVVECDLEGHEHLMPWLSSLYVPTVERGNSIGVSLIQAACDWARQKPYAAIYLYARKGRLCEFYEHLGWVPTDEIDLNGAAFQIMRKPFSGAMLAS